MADDIWASATWRKSSRSGGEGGECVEVAFVGNLVGVRDTKDRASAMLTFSAAEWAAFVAGVKNGEFEAP